MLIFIEKLKSKFCVFYRHFYHVDEGKISKAPMPENYLQLGRLCAAMYDSQWHRAEIIEVLDISVKVN